MRWFGRGQSQSVDKERRLAEQEQAQATMEALEDGRLPPYIRERIAEQRQGQLPWTSNLSVAEWLLTAKYRFRPLGMVMGSCFYHIGYSKADLRGSWSAGEFTVIARAIRDGRTKALERMAMEAEELGANAVIGVRVDTRTPGYFGHDTEFTAFGTAVAIDGLETHGRPLLCTVEGQELTKLLMHDSVPVGLALGVSVYYQYTSWQDKRREYSWFNQEMPSFTQAVYDARHNAMADMIRDARSLKGNGILAHDTRMKVYEVEVERGENDERTDHILEVVSLGTVVSAQKRPLPLDIRPVLSMNDKVADLAFEPLGE
ncbi:heavy metal-binding domain-containing protein [Alicyclobacillus fodiniaquatilis]|uniref:Heavy metal-binding domain-containing protein n=1 Tax=Alicyclobacillus fodiniaquatilis TaxID=1661150 RepID=A0ABW4JDZ8_9BACL